jgi:hypothetical protein
MKERIQSIPLSNGSRQPGVSPDHGHTEPAAGSTRDYPTWEPFNIRIEVELASYLCSLGDGDLSEGVMIAAKFHRENARGGD